MTISCPRCSATNQLKIVYGLPTNETFEAAERGDLVLGGCVIFGDDPQWRCPSCGQEHGRKEEAD